MPYSSLHPATLVVLGPLNQGTSLAVEDRTSPAITGPTALVVLTYQVASNGLTIFIPSSPVYPGLDAVVNLPQDGIYTFQGVRVQAQAAVPQQVGVMGETRYNLDDSKLYQVVSINAGLGTSLWSAQNLDYSQLIPQTGPVVYYLHTTTLTRAWNLLLLRVLHKELGPLPTLNQPDVDHLVDFLGKLDRGLDGAKFLFLDQNYPEAARVVELLSLTRYL